jgi:transitional endoplasmic reticulum ATPase
MNQENDDAVLELQVIEPVSEDVDTKKVRMNDLEMLDAGFKSGMLVKISGGNERMYTVGVVMMGNVDRGKLAMPSMMMKTTGLNPREKARVEIVRLQRIETVENASIEILSSNMDVETIPDMIKEDIAFSFKKNYSGMPIVNLDMFRVILVQGEQFDVKIISSTFPGVASIFKIGNNTDIIIKERGEVSSITGVRWEDVGGMKENLEDFRNLIELPLNHPELWERYQKPQPTGFLLHGPPGCGKTLMVKATSNECNASFRVVTPAHILGGGPGDSEREIKEIFNAAAKSAPTILFFDEIDAILPKRDEGKSQFEYRVVATILEEMDGLKNRDRVIVIGATNQPNMIEPAARRPGRFGKEIEIPPPNLEGRKEILKIHLRNVPIIDNEDDENHVDIEFLAKSTHGFVGADIAGMVRDAVYSSIKRNLPELSLDLHRIPESELATMFVDQDDLISAMKEIVPSALRSVYVDIPKMSFDDVGGLNDAKERLEEAVLWQVEKKDELLELGIRAPSGVLLYGPPGCGKTLLAKAVAGESQINFISIKGPEFFNKWVGQSEQIVRDIFKKARQVAPCIIFIDEFDSIAYSRGSGGPGETKVGDRIVAQLLAELDGIEKRKGVIMLASTNRPDIIDPALLRPGRIDSIVLVTAPDKESRRKIVDIHLKGKKIDDDVDMDSLADFLSVNTENFSGSDIEAVVMTAGIRALRDGRNSISMKDFTEALKRIGPSLDKKIIDAYAELRETLKKKVNQLPEFYS